MKKVKIEKVFRFANGGGNTYFRTFSQKNIDFLTSKNEFDPHVPNIFRV